VIAGTQDSPVVHAAGGYLEPAVLHAANTGGNGLQQLQLLPQYYQLLQL
jgi:hypothetical protein